jgi:hypothetical protein
MDVENQAEVGPDVALEDIEVDGEDDEANFMLTENQVAETAAKSVDAPAVTENTQLHSSSSPPNEGSSSTNEAITQTASEHQAAGADAPAINTDFPPLVSEATVRSDDSRSPEKVVTSLVRDRPGGNDSTVEPTDSKTSVSGRGDLDPSLARRLGETDTVQPQEIREAHFSRSSETSRVGSPT